jgi:hypothetical protein
MDMTGWCLLGRWEEKSLVGSLTVMTDMTHMPSAYISTYVCACVCVRTGARNIDVYHAHI